MITAVLEGIRNHKCILEGQNGDVGRIVRVRLVVYKLKFVTEKLRALSEQEFVVTTQEPYIGIVVPRNESIMADGTYCRSAICEKLYAKLIAYPPELLDELEEKALHMLELFWIGIIYELHGRIHAF